METLNTKQTAQLCIGDVNPRFKINGLFRRKEGWRYAYSIKTAKAIQKKSIEYGINSHIYELIDNEWVNVC